MNIEFDPQNNIIRLCVNGMKMQENGNSKDAKNSFLKAWNDSTNNFEKFISAYYIALYEKILPDRLKWFETSLHYAIELNAENVKSAFPTLYLNIGKCYEGLDNLESAKVNYERSTSFSNEVTDNGPFYHGTRAELKVGDLLTSGHNSNYKSELKMNHIYFTSNLKGARLASTMAKGSGVERVYIVEPTGDFENDPNVTDKKFPGNLTCSYRSQEPLKIIGEEINWKKQMPQEINKWYESSSASDAEIIN